LRAGFGIFTVVNLGQLQNNNESNPAVRAPIAMSTQRSSATAVASLETHRACAEAHILTIANSFEPDEPLRHSFLDEPLKSSRETRRSRNLSITRRCTT
jgi:hypothetical protein